MNATKSTLKYYQTILFTTILRWITCTVGECTARFFVTTVPPIGFLAFLAAIKHFLAPNTTKKGRTGEFGLFAAMAVPQAASGGSSAHRHPRKLVLVLLNIQVTLWVIAHGMENEHKLRWAGLIVERSTVQGILCPSTSMTGHTSQVSLSQQPILEVEGQAVNNFHAKVLVRHDFVEDSSKDCRTLFHFLWTRRFVVQICVVRKDHCHLFHFHGDFILWWLNTVPDFLDKCMVRWVNANIHAEQIELLLEHNYHLALHLALLHVPLLPRNGEIVVLQVL